MGKEKGREGKKGGEVRREETEGWREGREGEVTGREGGREKEAGRAYRTKSATVMRPPTSHKPPVEQMV
jgi:hypothetical protein